MRLHVGQVEDAQYRAGADPGDPAGLDQSAGEKFSAEYGIAVEAQAGRGRTGRRDDGVALGGGDPTGPA